MDEQWVRWILTGLVGLIMTVFGAMIRRLFNKQDELEKTKANKESSDARFNDVLTEIRLMRTDFRDHEDKDIEAQRDVLAEIRETNRHLSMTNATLANLVGRFDATNGH